MYFLFSSFCYHLPVIQESDQLVLKDSVYHFDTIQGRIQHYKCNFTYYNKGKSPLYITDIKTNCGCTYAQFSKEALAPGDSCQFSVSYISASKRFEFNEPATVFYYCDEVENSKIVHIDGYVIPRN